MSDHVVVILIVVGLTFMILVVKLTIFPKKSHRPNLRNRTARRAYLQSLEDSGHDELGRVDEISEQERLSEERIHANLQLSAKKALVERDMEINHQKALAKLRSNAHPPKK